MKKILQLLMVSLVFASCQKELSDEISGDPQQPNPAPNPTSCILDRISQLDQTGESLGFFGIDLNPNRQVTRFQSFDSAADASVYSFGVIRSGDTVKVNSDDYYVLDPANGNRVRAASLDLSNLGLGGSGFILLSYVYNAAGQLITRNGSLNIATPVPLPPVLVTTYTWQNGNLTRIVTRDAIQNETLIEGVYTYNTSLTVQDFTYYFADPIDNVFELGLNFGVKPTNMIQTLTLNTTNQNNDPVSDEYRFVNPEIDNSTRRVLRYVVETNPTTTVGLPNLYTGIHKTRYSCP
jgi:hypothetical protein